MAKYTTYSRTVMSDHRKFVELVQKYADPKAAIVREIDKDYKYLSVITASTLEEAIKHPHAQFLAYTIQTFAEYLRSVRQIYETRYEIVEEKLYIEESVHRFQDHLSELDGEGFDKLTEVVEQLEEQYVQLIALDNQLEENLDRLAGVIKDIMTIISDEDRNWDKYRSEFNLKIVNTFKELDFPLSELEQQELLSQDSWHSMLERVRDLKIDLPQDIDVANPTYSSYFKLKAYLAMYSSLSRRMLPNSAQEINQL